jgi:TBC1 domain family protein 5
MAWKVYFLLIGVNYLLTWSFELFLTPQEPLQSPSDVCSTPPLQSLRTSRKEYATMLFDKMRAPDGSYPEGFFVPGFSTLPKKSQVSGSLEKNNPLSLHNEV